jgi:hypothetical protein
MLQSQADAIKATLGNYSTIRKMYYESIFVAIYDYLDSDRSITSFRSTMTRAMVEAFTPAADIGWEDGGGTLPLDEETNAWLTAMQQAEIEYINVLFQNLKELRKSEEVDKTATATARADGYAQTLDMIYNHAKIAGAGNKMLTFVGDDGVESCTDCRKYKNKRRRAKWWIANDAVPPNRNFECRGYRCRHTLVDDNGVVWTL